MKIKAIRTNFENAPTDMIPHGYSHQTKTHITLNKEYEVFALCIFNGAIFVQIICDVNIPDWLPSTWLFEVTEKNIPSDWICNFFNSQPYMVMGPEFEAKDLESYEQMVELEPEAVTKFWERVKNQTNN